MNVRRLIFVVASNMKKTRGFTLIEMILYVAIVSIFLGGVVQLAWNALYGRVKTQSVQRVQSTARFIGKRLMYEIRNASGIVSVSASSLCLSSADPARNPTRIYLVGDTIRLGWGGGDMTCQTTTVDVPLSGFSGVRSTLVFTNVSSALTRHVQFTYTVSSSAVSGRQEYAAAATYEGSAEVR